MLKAWTFDAAVTIVIAASSILACSSDGNSNPNPLAAGGASGASSSSSSGGAPASAGGVGNGASGANTGAGGLPGTAGGASSMSVAGGAGTTTGGTGGTSVASRFPFPQNTLSSRCAYPTARNANDARAAYDAWKAELVTADGAGGHQRVRRPNSPGGEVNSTVSEGIAYGMVLSMAMDDQTLFDELWKYSQLWLNGNGLMNWYINAAGTAPLGTGGATDADEDIAWALVMAERKWGGAGSLSDTYLNLARLQIDRIWRLEVDHAQADLLLPGDTWGGSLTFNPSYFAPNQYRIFGQVTGDTAGWNRVIDTGYAILARSLNATSGNATNGLVPAWCSPDGTPLLVNGASNYQYDSARTPFRIGQDFCYSGESRAAAYLAKISGFFAGVGAASIVDGYDLNGAPHPDPATPAGSPQSAVFLGSAAVGAMHAAQYQALVDDAYSRVRTLELLARSRYYNRSWTALSLLMLTGNLIEYSP